MRIEDAVLPLASRKTRLADWLPLLIIGLFLLPLPIYWAYVHLYKPVSPFFESYDPEFSYLLNSLGVFKGRAYFFADHPGTPVELLGTFFYLLIYPFLRLGRQDFILYNLQNPGVFLNIAHAFLTLASMGCALYFFRLAAPAKQIGSVLFGAALAMSFFALNSVGLDLTTIWSHNSFAFPAGTLLLLFFLKALTKEPQGEVSIGSLVWLGVAAGIFASITIFFGTWVAGMLIALVVASRLQRRSWASTIRSSGWFLGGAVAGFGLMLLPMLKRAPYFFGFVLSLVTHANPYLGAAGVPLLQRLGTNLLHEFHAAPQLVLMSGLLLVIAVIALRTQRDRLSQNPGLAGIICGLSIQILLLFVVLLNDYLNKYFVAVAAVLPVLGFALMRLYQPAGRPGLLIQYATTVLVIIGLLANLRLETVSQNKFADSVDWMAQQEQAAVQQYAHGAGKSPDEVKVLWTYGTYSPCLSLFLGNRNTGYAFNQELQTLCPNFYLYDIFTAGIAHVTSDAGSLEVVRIASVADLDWDVYFGCDKSFGSAPGVDEINYTMITPAAKRRVNCHGVPGTFVIVYRK